MSASRVIVGGTSTKTCVSLLRKASTSSDGASTACPDSAQSDMASFSDDATPRLQQECEARPCQRWLKAQTDARSAIDAKNEPQSDATESEGEAPTAARRRRRRRGARRSRKIGTTTNGEAQRAQESILTNASFRSNLIHEQAAVTLLDLGLLVNVQPNLCSTGEVSKPLSKSDEHLASARQVPRPTTLEHGLELPPASEERCFAWTPSMLWPATPSDEQRCPRTPSTMWPAAPHAENDRLRTPTTLWPATPLGERDCPQTPSTLWPATPMAWPAMAQCMRVSSPKQDATGHESIPSSWRNVTVGSVLPFRGIAVADGAGTTETGLQEE
jgi:hypothetical protein